MSLDYVEGRIKEALRLTNGNAALARQQVIAWAFEDMKLLYALAKPHLSGIVAYNIERVASGRSSPKPKASPPKKSASGSGEDFGIEILRAVASSTGTVFGLEGDTPVIQKRGQVSKSHVDALRMMAAKSKTKKK